VFLRTLLFSTSKHGRVIESLHVALYHNETHQNFTTWVYGERDQLMLGSGLFVGETGVAANHHFLAPYDSKYQFTEGQYRLDVVARLHGDRDAKLLFSQELTISREVAAALAEPATGLYFEWGPDAKRYLPYVDKRPPLPDPEDFIGVLAALRPGKD